MDVVNFSSLESHVLDMFKAGKKTFEALTESVSINEKNLYLVLEGLVSKNILKLNTTTNEYEFQTKVEGDIVVLDGNLFLPTTILKINDKIYVSRGEWYEFPADFDTRRIVWNVKLDVKTNSTLVELIRSSIIKEKKTKIIHNPDYDNLQNKIVPYSKTLGIELHNIGDQVTEASLMFKIKLNKDDESVGIEFRNFKVKTQIDTEELLKQVNLPIAERNYQEITINKIYGLSDFIYQKNEIPISITNNNNVTELTYVKLTGIKKVMELTYYKMDSIGNNKKIDVDTFEDSSEFVEKIRDLFRGLPSLILSENNCVCELTE